MDLERKKVLMVIYSIFTAISLLITLFVIGICSIDKDYNGMIEMIGIFIVCEAILIGPEFVKKDGIFRGNKENTKS